MKSKVVAFGHEKLTVYQIPEYPTYHISKCGHVYSDTLGHCIKPWRNNSGYYYFNLTDYNAQLAARHRLLCRVFKPVDNWENLLVNHKNGIRGDDILENLEWVTEQENVYHAGEMLNSPKCTPLLVMNAWTREITKYPSILACAMAFGYSKDTVNYRSKSDGQIIWPDGKLYKPYHSKTDWLVFKEEDINIEIKRSGTSKACMLRQLPDGDIIYFDDQTSLAKHLGISTSTLSVWLNMPDQPVFPGFVQLKYLRDNTPWREIDDIYLELQKTNKACRIIVVDEIGSEEVKIFFSAVECAKAYGLLPTTLNWRLNAKTPVIYSPGVTVRYYDSSYNKSLSPHRVTEE